MLYKLILLVRRHTKEHFLTWKLTKIMYHIPCIHESDEKQFLQFRIEIPKFQQFEVIEFLFVF